MKTASQKKAKELLNNLPHINMIKLLTKCASDNRCYIGDELYVNASSFGYFSLERFKRLAKRKGWRPSDLFPAVVSCPYYDGIAYLVRIGALEAIDTEELKGALYRPSELGRHKDTVKEVLKAAHEPWAEASMWKGRNEALTDERCVKAIEAFKERNRLIYAKEEMPEIETCIRVLKDAGYKILKPVTEYKEI